MLRELRRRRFPDGDEASGHHFASRLVWEGEETKGNYSTGLIGGRLGMELAVVREPTATSSAETEQSSAIPRLNEAEELQGGE